MEIGIFGGSFNPIHIGHCIVASHIAQHTSVDEVWLNVSPQNPLKEKAEDYLAEHRLKMAALAVNDCDRLKVCDIEFQMPVPSYSISTLRKLRSLYPTDHFRLIIGSDNWLIFDKWKDYQEIISEFGVIVYPRPGYELPSMILPKNVEFVDAPQIELSSTFIRDCVRNGLDLHFLVPEIVRDYILSNNLYK